MPDASDNDLSFTQIAPGCFRFWCDDWDEHTCAEVDFVGMTYTMRFQRSDEAVEAWEKRVFQLKRVDSSWLTCLDEVEQARVADELEKKVSLLRDRIAEFADRIPVEETTRYSAALTAMRADIAELRAGPRWTLLTDHENRILVRLYARMQG